MQDLEALKMLTKKLDTIKESWQIYELFEDARAAFNAELTALKKDKEKLVDSFNSISAKNAMLLAQNKELEAKNKALQMQNSSLEMQNSNTISHKNLQESQDSIYLPFMYAQCQALQKTLQSMHKIFTTLPPKAMPLEKLEVSYQKHQRLLANPAKDYVSLEVANCFFDALMLLESKIKTLDLDLSKLLIELHDILETEQDSKENLESQNSECNIN